MTALNELVELGDFEGLRARVEQQGADINERGASGGDTALHVACTKLLANAVDYLLAHGAAINTANAIGATPLHKLATSPLARDSRLHSRVLAIAQTLLEHGADAGAPNSSGLTPMSMAPFDGFRDLLRAHCAVETLLVDQQQLPRLIGRGGNKLLGLRSKHGVAIDTPRQFVPLTPTTTTVEVNITGTRERVDAAKKEIEELLAKWRAADEALAQHAAEMARAKAELEERRAQDDTVTVLTIPKQHHGRIVGQRMATLHALQSELDVEITVPPADSEDEGVRIKGKQDAVALAAERIIAVSRQSSTPPPQQRQSPRPQSGPRTKLHIERKTGGEAAAAATSTAVTATTKVEFRRAPRNIIGIKTQNPREHARMMDALANGEDTTTVTAPPMRQSPPPPLPSLSTDDPTPAEAAARRK